MGRIWESINASNQHMLTHVPIGQIASSPLCLCLSISLASWLYGYRRLWAFAGFSFLQVVLGDTLGHTDYLRACLQVSLAFKFVSDLVKVFGVLFSGTVVAEEQQVPLIRQEITQEFTPLTLSSIS